MARDVVFFPWFSNSELGGVRRGMIPHRPSLSDRSEARTEGRQLMSALPKQPSRPGAEPG